MVSIEVWDSGRCVLMWEFAPVDDGSKAALIRDIDRVCTAYDTVLDCAHVDVPVCDNSAVSGQSDSP